MVAQICNLSFLGGRGLEGHSLRSVWAKSFWGPISTNGWVQWLTPVNPSYTGKHK
jgi:hypothetical protein